MSDVACEVPSHRRFSLEEIRNATDDFNKSKFIGRGSFGMVYKGVIVDWAAARSTLVAVKRLGPESKQGIGEFETEIKMLSKSTHCNLVHLVGYCNEDQEMILVYEYMSRGSLADHLYMNRNSLLTWEQRLKICIGAARGLDYLHTGTGLSERIIHLDVKSDNILLNNNFDAKVADLGLSRKGPANQRNSEVNTSLPFGTPAYIDPQFCKECKFSRKADVYSFGVVLLEVLTGTSAWGAKIIPKPEVADRADWIQHYISSQTLDQIIDSRVLAQIQPESLKRFAYTVRKMLQRDPKNRPSMSSVVAQLEYALEFQCSSHPVVNNNDEDHHFDVGYEGVTTRRISSAGEASYNSEFIPKYLVKTGPKLFGTVNEELRLGAEIKTQPPTTKSTQHASFKFSMKTNTDKNTDEHPRSAETTPSPHALVVNSLSSCSSFLNDRHDPSNFSCRVKTGPALFVKAKALFEKVKGELRFMKIFGEIEGEKLLKASQCCLYTTAGPISGTFFISTQNVAFYSDKPITWPPSPSGVPIQKPYKVLIPTNKIKKANKSENEKNPAEKYIHIVTNDDFEFWFTEVKYYEKAFRKLEKALAFRELEKRLECYRLEKPLTFRKLEKALAFQDEKHFWAISTRIAANYHLMTY